MDTSMLPDSPTSSVSTLDRIRQIGKAVRRKVENQSSVRFSRLLATRRSEISNDDSYMDDEDAMSVEFQDSNVSLNFLSCPKSKIFVKSFFFIKVSDIGTQGNDTPKIFHFFVQVYSNISVKQLRLRQQCARKKRRHLETLSTPLRGLLITMALNVVSDAVLTVNNRRLCFEKGISDTVCWSSVNAYHIQWIFI